MVWLVVGSLVDAGTPRKKGETMNANSTSELDPRFGSNTSPAFSGHTNITCVVGDVGLAAGRVAGGTVAKGQILQITDYQALFSVLGNTYGGDGKTTFALPDLREAAPNGLTYYICTVGAVPSPE